jgi:hypothetical protein
MPPGCPAGLSVHKDGTVRDFAFTGLTEAPILERHSHNAERRVEKLHYFSSPNNKKGPKVALRALLVHYMLAQPKFFSAKDQFTSLSR